MRAKDFRRVKRAKIRGKSYRMIWRKPRDAKPRENHVLVGLWRSNPAEMHIWARQSPIMLLDTAIHESLHACFPDADESAISQSTNGIMGLLMRMGISVQFNPNERRSYDWQPAES